METFGRAANQFSFLLKDKNKIALSVKNNITDRVFILFTTI